MASNDDLMISLKLMEEKREKDKEKMAEARKKERQEDREEMLKLMDGCIGEKVGELMEPYKERTERLERGQLEMKGQVDMLLGQMDRILSSSNEKEQQCSSASEINPRFESRSPSQATAHPISEIQEEKRKKLISLSRRTVGLQRIDSHDIQRMYQQQYGGAKSEEEAQMLAVKEYLKGELKLTEGTIEDMNIERIFAPVRENPEWLYVTFKYESSVS